MTHMMSMLDHVAIDVEILRIDNGYFLEKEFTKSVWILEWYYT